PVRTSVYIGTYNAMRVVAEQVFTLPTRDTGHAGDRQMRHRRLLESHGTQRVLPTKKSLGDYKRGRRRRSDRQDRTTRAPAAGCAHAAQLLHCLWWWRSRDAPHPRPLINSVGLDAQWHIIAGRADFFTVTKSMHNALQGTDLQLTPAMRAVYLHTSVDNATSFEGEFDYVVVHDPQPTPLRMLHASDPGTWSWRCRIDLTAASPTYWSFLRPFVQTYDAAIFTLPTYVKHDLHVGKI